MRKKGTRINRKKFFSILEQKRLNLDDFIEAYIKTYGIKSREAKSTLRRKILEERQMNFKTVTKIAKVLGVADYEIASE